MSKTTQEKESLEREEWVMIGHLSYDYEAEIVSSLFDSRGILMMIQGRNHRRMLGFLGGYIQMRVLVPKAQQENGVALLEEYHQLRDHEQPEGLSEGERAHEGRGLLFNETGKKMGIALFLDAFLGFGLGSLSAGCALATVVLAPLQAMAYAPELCAPMIDQVASLISISPADYIVLAKSYLPLIDLMIAWTYLIYQALFRSKN